LQGLKNWGRREGDVWEGGTVQLSKQGIPSFGQKHSGHEFLEIYKASAFRLFVPPLKILLKMKTCPPGSLVYGRLTHHKTLFDDVLGCF
jgi:hypothetical protein